MSVNRLFMVDGECKLRAKLILDFRFQISDLRGTDGRKFKVPRAAKTRNLESEITLRALRLCERHSSSRPSPAYEGEVHRAGLATEP